MNSDHLKTICAHFSLGQPTAEPVRVTGGLLHHMWQVKNDRGLYAVKQISRNLTFTPALEQQFNLTELIAAAFQEHGIPVVTSLKKDDASIVTVGDDHFIVYPWLEGKALSTAAAPIDKAQKIATILAHMHRTTLEMPQLDQADYPIHSHEELDQLLSPVPGYDWHLITTLNDKYRQAIPLLKTVSVISHGDLDQKNVLWTDAGAPFLIDWESARRLNPTQKILNLALDWSGVTTGEVDQTIFTAIIDAYRQAGGILQNDQMEAALYGILGNWINWLAHNARIYAAQKNPEALQQIDQTYRTINRITNDYSTTIFTADFPG